MGDGKSIRIWKDKWLTSKPGFQPRTPRGEYDEDGMVHELIGEQTKTWNQILLQEMFDTKEAASINSIPLSRIGSPDRLVWHYDKKGVYTIKSGYKLLNKAYMEVNNQGMRTDQKLWKKIWATSLPRRIQVFLWRILHEILLVNKNLESRKIQLTKFAPGVLKRMKQVTMRKEDAKLLQRFGNRSTGSGTLIKLNMAK